jgi:hypothetical protein
MLNDRPLFSFLFYVFGVFVAGLLVPYNHPGLSPKDSNNGTQYVQSSPFIIAMGAAGIKFVCLVVPVHEPKFIRVRGASAVHQRLFYRVGLVRSNI